MTMTPGEPSAGRNIFVVEDELMIRMLLEDMLSDLGYTVVAMADGIDEALTLARDANFDVALLDVNLNGKTVVPVAQAIQLRGLPFVFATGYGERGLPEEFRDRPALQKPFQQETLSRALVRACGGVKAA